MRALLALRGACEATGSVAVTALRRGVLRPAAIAAAERAAQCVLRGQALVGAEGAAAGNSPHPHPHVPPPLCISGEAAAPWSAPDPTLSAFPDATALLHVARAAHVRAFSPESLSVSPTHTRLRVARMHLQPEASRSQVGAGAAGAQAARHSARPRGADAAEAELGADAGALGCAATGGGSDLF